MGLVLIGISHNTAPVALRERLSVADDRLEAVLRRVSALPDVAEAVVLSTCNRVEIYARPAEDRPRTIAALRGFVDDLWPGVPVGGALYEHAGAEAVRHLFRVAAGLDSLVLGETQVLGQVKSAYRFAHAVGTTGKVTNVLFQRALYVGKQVRVRTDISQGGSSVGNVAVQLAEKIFGSLKGRRVTLVGAGKMAEITARHLLSQKAGKLTILNRTVENAQALAAALNGRARPLDALDDELLFSDIAIFSAATDRSIADAARIAPLMERRRQQSLYIIDIAVPRNVNADVHRLDNVYVYDIDDLRSIVDENLEKRRGALEDAGRLVDGWAREFHEWIAATLRGESAALKHAADAAIERGEAG